MSLINQALRKAQRDRTPNRMPSVNAEAGMSSSYAAPPKRGPGLIIGLVLGIAILVGIVAGLTVLLLQKKPATAMAQNETAPALKAETITSPQTAPAPTAPTSTATASASVMQPPTVQAPAQSIEPVAPTNSLLAQMGAAREEVQEKVEAAEIQANLKSSPDVLEWLSTAQVAGVRLSAKGNKAIINGKTYKVGDTIDYELEIRVVSIAQNLITLSDANSKEYELNF
ncbi:MAG: hypothetical protein AAGH40_12745 [Verrucomicrobiota bacterium]